MGDVVAFQDADGGRLTPPAALPPSHDLSGFCCGKPPLDDWLRARAASSDGMTARTYVVCQGSTVIGYYCLATGSEQRKSMPRKMRQGIPDPVPLMIIGRLAVDRGFAGRGIGRGLLQDSLLRIVSASQIVGCRAVLVHAIDEDGASFYVKFGFVEFPAGSHTMFLPLDTVAAGL